MADAVVFAMNYVAGRLAHRIVAYTQDYADHSPLLRRFRQKIRVIPPPVIMPARRRTRYRHSVLATG